MRKYLCLISRTGNSKGDRTGTEWWALEKEPEWYDAEDIDALRQLLQKQYGRTVCSQYTDLKDGSRVRNGWVFKTRSQEWDYSERTGPHWVYWETWVTVWEVTRPVLTEEAD